jgi:hypothetical protein
MSRSVEASNNASDSAKRTAAYAAQLATANRALLHEQTVASVERRRKIAQSDLDLCRNVYTTVGGTLTAIIGAQLAQVTVPFYRQQLPSLTDQEILNLVTTAHRNGDSELATITKKFDPASCKKLPSQSFAPKVK